MITLTLPDGFAPVVSERDRAAPTFAEARKQGLLPTFEDCLAYRRSLA